MVEIKKLPEHVINKIAAGEVVQRPCNAIKELIENSIDADSGSIKLKVKKGGLDLIHIEDDGSGIAKNDLELAGVRFATSKLSEYDDLKTIQSFGFRGEALASISHVSRLQIISKTKEQPVAYKISYLNGQPESAPAATAGKFGTMIRATDLYYNMPTRRNALSGNDEIKKIIEIIKSYSIHYNQITFSLFNADTNKMLVKTSGGDKPTAIKMAYGTEAGKDLLHFEQSIPDVGVTAEGFITNSSYDGKKIECVTFINNRLVYCKSIKKIVENVSNNFLGKLRRPLVYISLVMPGSNIDVNVHPTKLEVQFLHEEKIIDMIQQELDKLFNIGTRENKMDVCATFYNAETSISLDVTAINSPRAPIRENRMIREDFKNTKLDSFFELTEDVGESSSAEAPLMKLAYRRTPKRKADLDLTICGIEKRQKLSLESMAELRKIREESVDIELKGILKNCVVVGAVSPSQFIIQSDVDLLLLDLGKISNDLFYQIILQDYGNFLPIEITPGVNVAEVMKITSVPAAKSEVFVQNLVNMKDMLEDYFGITIDKVGNITSMPMLVEGCVPCFHLIHHFFVDLCEKIVWDDETMCLGTISKALSDFYSFKPESDPFYIKSEEHWEQIIEHNILPLIKSNTYRPAYMSSRPYRVLTSLPTLYKVFERC